MLKYSLGLWKQKVYFVQTKTNYLIINLKYKYYFTNVLMISQSMASLYIFLIIHNLLVYFILFLISFLIYNNLMVRCHFCLRWHFCLWWHFCTRGHFCNRGHFCTATLLHDGHCSTRGPFCTTSLQQEGTLLSGVTFG